MARGSHSTVRSERTAVTVASEYEYVVSLSEFLDMLGISHDEELRSFHYHYNEDKLTIKTRQVL